jgi:formate dehydrogenase major subunit
MCGRGRFGINYIQKDGRLTAPLLRKSGELVPVSWYDAFIYAAKKMESLKIRGEKTAVSIGHSYCVEDAGAILSLARLLSSDVMSFMGRENGLVKVLGYDGSPNTLDEVASSGSLFVFGDSMLTGPATLSRLRKAVRNGAEVTVISESGGQFNLKCKVVKAPETTEFIKQITKALIDAGNAPKNADGFDELKASLSKIEAGDDAKAIAGSYKAAKKAMILYALDELSSAAATELANMAVVAGHIGSPRDGIFMLRQMSGSQALSDYGVTATAEAAMGAKGLMIFGEDPVPAPDGAGYAPHRYSHESRYRIPAGGISGNRRHIRKYGTQGAKLRQSSPAANGVQDA